MSKGASGKMAWGVENRGRDLSSFYAHPSLLQLLSILERSLEGTDFLTLVVGERGSGKTILLNRLLMRNRSKYRTCKIWIRNPSEKQEGKKPDHLNGRVVHIWKNASRPVLIFDDAHDLSPPELKTILNRISPSDSSCHFKSAILFGESKLLTALPPLTGEIPPKAVIKKLFIPPLTLKQTKDYVDHRMEPSGLPGRKPFGSHHYGTMHENSEGLPGRINEEVRKLLREGYLNKSGLSGFFVLHRTPLLRVSYLSMAVVALIFSLIFLFQTLSDSSSPSKGLFFPDQMDPMDNPAEKALKVSYPISSHSLPLEKKGGEIHGGEEKGIYRESWLLAQNAGHYTLQITAAHKEESILKMIDDFRLKGRVAYYHTRYKTGDWYRLLFGIYETRSKAQAAIAELHEEIRQSMPWPRKLSAVHGDIERES